MDKNMGGTSNIHIILILITYEVNLFTYKLFFKPSKQVKRTVKSL